MGTHDVVAPRRRADRIVVEFCAGHFQRELRVGCTLERRINPGAVF